MRSKYLISTALVGLFVMGTAFGVIAQQQGKRVERGDRGKIAMRMADKLNLSQSQRSQIQGIMEQARAEGQRIRQSNLSQEQKRSQLKALRQQTKERINAVLTPEQRQKAAQMRKTFKHHRGRGMQRLFAQLNLTETQKAQIRTIMEGAKAEAKAIKSSNRTNEQKRADFRSLRTRTKDQINAILTPEQRQKAAELMKQHRGKCPKVGRPAGR